jgi:hypothetical protein
MIHVQHLTSTYWIAATDFTFTVTIIFDPLGLRRRASIFPD